jgi:tyrosine-protein kinase Etk/Wzc
MNYSETNDPNLDRSKGAIIRFVLQILANWYYIALSCLFTCSIAFLLLRYGSPLYQTSATLLIKDNSRNTKGGMEDFIQGLDLLKSGKNIENEIGILRSFQLNSKALKDLNFGVSYFVSSRIKEAELFGHEVPYHVKVDSLDINPPPPARFNVKFISPTQYQLSYVAKDGQEERRVEKQLAFGQLYNGEGFAFTLSLVKGTPIPNLDERHSFALNNMNAIVESYRNRIRIKPIVRQSTILELVIEDVNVAKAQAYLNKLLEVYIERGLEEKNQTAINTIRFIDDQLSAIQDSLVMAEYDLERFRVNNRVMDVGKSAELLFEEVNALESDRAKVSIQLQYYRYILKSLESDQIDEVIAPSVVGVADVALNTLVPELLKLNTQRKAASSQLTELNPYLQELDIKIREVKNTLVANIRNLINATEITNQDLKKQAKLLEVRVLSLPQSERKLVGIQRKFNFSDEIYTYLFEKRAEAGIAKAANTSDSRILDTAKQARRTSLNPRSFYGVAIVIGLMVPIGILALIGIFDDRVKNPEVITAMFKAPPLGIIPHNPEKEGLVTVTKPKSLTSEAFRSLRANLAFLSAKSGGKLIVITSSVGGEGKSFTSMNLAVILASSGKKVILIGADLRKPKLFMDFGMENTVGLSNYLAQQCGFSEVCQPTKYAHLDIVLSGPVPPNPGELLGSETMRELLVELKAKYDYVVVDTPPIGLVADAIAIAVQADINLYLVKCNYTRIGMLDAVKNLMDNQNLNRFNIIFNDVALKRRGYGYGYGYGYGGGYYDEGRQDKSFRGWLGKFWPFGK